MKSLTLYLLLLMFVFNSKVFSSELDCTQHKKFSAKYIECNARKLKEKTSDKMEVGKEKFGNTTIGDKFKKFKNSKSLSDLIKN